MSNKLKAAIIGNGSIAQAHRKAYARLAEENAPVEVVAYCDIRPERLENLGNCRTYIEIDEILSRESGVADYLDICLPTYLHAEVAVKAMEAGFNVICEKPMALNFEQAELMCKIAKKTGKTLMIAHCNRFMNVVTKIREYINSGKFGKVRNAEFWREGGNTEPMGYQNWFRKAELSGGAMLDLHIHDADVIQWLFGMPKAVSVTALNIIPGGGYDSMSVNYIYDDKYVRAGCDWTIKHDKFNTRASRVNFERGYIYSDRTPGRSVCVAVDNNGNTTDLSKSEDFYYEELKYYTNCLINGEPVTLCQPESAAQSVRLIMAEMASADLKGEKVKLEEI